MIPCIQRDRQWSLAEQMSFLLSAAAQARKNSSERSLTLARAPHLTFQKQLVVFAAQRRVILFSPSIMKCDMKLGVNTGHVTTYAEITPPSNRGDTLLTPNLPVRFLGEAAMKPLLTGEMR